MSRDSSRGTEINSNGKWQSIPDDIRNFDQWIVTKNKKPIRPVKGWQKKSNQFAFDEAREEAVKTDAELGFTLSERDPFAVIDLDDVGVPSTHTKEVTEIIERLATYTEVSRSGSGLHIICRDGVLPGYKHDGPLNQRGSIEVYDSNQQIVLTADQLEERSTITEGGRFFRELQQEYLPEDDGTDASAAEADESGQTVSIETQSKAGGNESGPTVDQIKRTIDAWADDGSDAARRAKVLWESLGSGTYESPSEADLAFASDLAFWCREDARLMYRCIRRSNRYRQKWDETHHSDGSTYAEMTIERAIDTNIDEFTGRYVL
jgi:putative DNA primase/helicase